jgi:hypothetical protein
VSAWALQRKPVLARLGNAIYWMLRVLYGNPFPEEKKHVGIFKVLARK